MTERKPKHLHKPNGRPPKLNADAKTLGLVRGLGQIQATGKECAAVLGVTEPTWIKFKADNPEIAEAYAEGAGQGLASLRRKQFKMAETNASMAIFLGKNYLGQSDKQEFSGPNGGAIATEVTHRIDKASAEIIANLVK